MEEMILSELKRFPSFVRQIYVWKEVIIGVLGPLAAALIAIWQVRKLVLSTRRQYFETIKQEQTGILKSLSAELSAFIYFQLDLIDKLDEKKLASVRNIPDRVIFNANSGRVGSMTGRAFGMLTIYYTRLDHLVRDITDAGRVTDDLLIQIRRSIGHAALIKTAMAFFVRGNETVKLSEIPDADFQQAINGYTEQEKTTLEACRTEWLEHIRMTGRT